MCRARLLGKAFLSGMWVKDSTGRSANKHWENTEHDFTFCCGEKNEMDAAAELRARLTISKSLFQDRNRGNRRSQNEKEMWKADLQAERIFLVLCCGHASATSLIAPIFNHLVVMGKSVAVSGYRVCVGPLTHKTWCSPYKDLLVTGRKGARTRIQFLLLAGFGAPWIVHVSP